MEELLQKYINEDCDYNEFIKAVVELEAKVPSDELTSFMKKHWFDLEINEFSGNFIDKDIVLDRIHHDINLFESKEMSKHWYERKRLFNIGIRVAAIFIIGIFISVTSIGVDRYVNGVEEQMVSSITPARQVSKIILPDNTEVWLNSDSRFSYSTRFGEKNRIVELEGEGYFKVAKNEKLPFVVLVNGVEVKVLGTQFNVEAYDQVKVTLEEGSVEVKKDDVVIKLKPGEQAVAEGEFIRIKKSVETDMYTSWHKGEMVFSDASLFEISHQLEKTYDVKFHFESQDLKDLQLRGKFRSVRTIYHVLEVLKVSAGIEYEIKGVDVYIREK